jgi:transcriptional regulator with XRE-family HTH domain
VRAILFNQREMSGRSDPSSRRSPSGAASAALSRIAAGAGGQIHDARLARRWTLRELAERGGIAVSSVHAVEAGRVMSLDTYARLATALGLRPLLTMESGRRPARRSTGDTADFVHAAMGEVEASHLGSFGFSVAIDEPYQHYQFAGRGDLLAWNLEERRLLHIENKSRLVDLQELAGTYNAKRAYLAPTLADRLGMGSRDWRSVDHVLAVLWSSEVLHVLRLREATFRALCPSPLETFAAWWQGSRSGDGSTSTLVILDPAANLSNRRPRYAGLDRLRSIGPRYRDYADAATVLSRR